MRALLTYRSPNQRWDTVYRLLCLWVVGFVDKLDSTQDQGTTQVAQLCWTPVWYSGHLLHRHTSSSVGCLGIGLGVVCLAGKRAPRPANAGGLTQRALLKWDVYASRDSILHTGLFSV